MPETSVLSLDEKIKLVATEVYEHVNLNRDVHLSNHRPGLQITQLLSKDEYIRIMHHLQHLHLISGLIDDVSNVTILSADRLPGYHFTVDMVRLRTYLGIQPPAPAVPFTFNKTLGQLHIKGSTIPLRHGSLRYLTAQLCVRKPGQAIQETDIMEKYQPDYEIDGRDRAIRDAANGLNERVKAATGIDNLFVYHNGYVTFDSQKIQN